MLNLVLIGFGTVGQGFAEILQSRAETLDARIIGVSTLRRGSVYAPDGLDISALLTAIQSGSLAAYPDQPGLIRDLTPLETIQRAETDVVIEVSNTDLITGEPALSHCRAALASNKHLIIANKGPAVLAYHELSNSAQAKRLFFGVEGTVMSGTPSIRLAREALAGCRILGLRGILNGTTNFMLSLMETGQSYAAALAEAQRLGYAEADPAGDVEGHDAAGKLAILTNIVMGATLFPNDVQTSGIIQITPDDIKEAAAAGERWKLIASAEITSEGKVSARVRLERLPLSDPLAGVSGVNNAVTYQTDLLGAVTLIGAGAGRQATGFAILSDLLALQRWQR